MSSIPAFPAPAHESDAEQHLLELDQIKRKLDRYIEFIEVVEALTFDAATARRIRSFLQQEGVWLSSKKQD